MIKFFKIFFCMVYINILVFIFSMIAILRDHDDYFIDVVSDAYYGDEKLSENKKKDILLKALENYLARNDEHALEKLRKALSSYEALK